MLKFIALWVVVPYLIGLSLSKIGVIPQSFLEDLLEPLIAQASGGRRLQSVDPGVISSRCERRLHRILNSNGIDPFQGASIVLHRNGEATPCGRTEKSILPELLQAYSSFQGDEECPHSLNKYQVEALLTKTMHMVVDTCVSMEKYGKKKDGLLGFCDMGPKHTPILLDHDELVPVVSPGNKTSLPCRFHTREGLRVSQFRQLAEMTKSAPTPQNCQGDAESQTCTVEENTQREFHLYAVPAGRVFMFAPAFIGEIFELPHVEGSDNKNIHLEVLSLSPRVFDVFNFFSREESQDLVDRAVAETSESHRIKRSSTGASGYNINSRRTSESGFDTHGKTAVKVKKRCFKALGFDEYSESHGDGLQILRYNLTTAYTPHMDWIEDKTKREAYNFDSAGTGGNRFATILLYMTDLNPEDGGETVFTHGWPPGLPKEERVDSKTALEELRASDRGNVLERGSWQEDMVSKCRTRLSIRPHSSRAVLFYSQKPNGEADQASLHGGCPVLSNSKFAANLWVWNTPRQGFPGAPLTEKGKAQKGESPTKSPEMEFKQVVATFHNTKSKPEYKNAELYFEEKQLWGKLGHGDPDLDVNTYDGHRWNIYVDGKVVKSWTISEKGGTKQKFEI